MRIEGASTAIAGTPNHQHPEVVRTYNVKLQKNLVRVLPGAFYSTRDKNEVIVTILGSCVAACIRNPVTGFGGLNHFMLPESEGYEWNGVTAALRYGNHAMEALINQVMAAGCSRHDLEIKLFGGANLYKGMGTVGEKNAEFARTYLSREGLRIVAEDLGGDRARRIHYDPGTGRVQRLFLRHKVDQSVSELERDYRVQLNKKPVVSGEIELFD